MTLPVVTAPEADAQIRTIDAWWRANRPAATDLFANELADCIELLAQAPKIGKPYRQYPVVGLRRILLRASRYHVYYIQRADVVAVLAVWQARRGQGPPL